jgi:hypothetical protein
MMRRKLDTVAALLAASVCGVAGPAGADVGDATCEREAATVTGRVVRAIERAGAPWTDLGPLPDLFCTGEVSFLRRRRVVSGPRIDAELVYASGTHVYRSVTLNVPAPLQEHADPGTIDAISAETFVATCPDGSSFFFRGTGNDVPADVGSASGSNPNIEDFGGDDYLTVLTTVCPLP